MKRGQLIKKIYKISILAVILILGIFLWTSYADRQNCICSQLTDKIQRFEIDKKLLAVYDIADTKSGTFVRVITHCKHDERLQLIIYSDEGFYYGCKSEM